MRNLLWSGFLTALLLSGCGWSGSASRPNTFTPLTSITITATYSTIAQGTSVKLTATGNYSGLFTRDISDQVTWTSNAATVANFVNTTSSPSRVTGLTPGSAVLTASMGGVSASFNLTVSSATATGVTIAPVVPSVAQGLNQEFTATGTFSDSTTQDITFDATWSSSDTSVATLAYSDSDGKETATTLAVGTTTITATFEGFSDSTVLTVTAPVLQSIAISTPNNITSVLSLSTVTFTATGTYSNNTTKDITSQVTWNSSNTSVAPAPNSAGVTQTVTQGTTNIAASLGNISSTSTTLTVTGGNLANSPTLTNMTVVKGTSIPISVTGTFSNGTTRDITGALAWSVDNTNIATVTTVSGNRLLVNAVATGTTTIRATYPGSTGVAQTSSAPLTVTNPALLTNGYTITLNTQDLTAGTSTRVTATASFNDNTTQDVTANIVLTSNSPTIASVGSVGPGGTFVQGGIPIILGQTAGKTDITAKLIFGNQTVNLVNPIQVTVSTPGTLQSITITPSGTQSLTSGNQVPFTATATYNSGPVDVTDIATWSIDDPNIAILADSQNQPGQVIGVGSGTTTLKATFGNQSQTVTIKVP
jgi:hypothetical protein